MEETGFVWIRCNFPKHLCETNLVPTGKIHKPQLFFLRKKDSLPAVVPGFINNYVCRMCGKKIRQPEPAWNFLIWNYRGKIITDEMFKIMKAKGMKHGR